MAGTKTPKLSRVQVDVLGRLVAGDILVTYSPSSPGSGHRAYWRNAPSARISIATVYSLSDAKLIATPPNPYPMVRSSEYAITDAGLAALAKALGDPTPTAVSTPQTSGESS
jgi:hypothetical protein